MRVLVDMAATVLGTPKILQLEKNPDFDDLIPINGKWALSVIEGSNLHVDVNSYILPVDGGDVYSQSYANLLAQFPMYNYVYFNPLITEDHVGEIDLAATYTDPITTDVFESRVQTGRATGLNVGNAPNSTALLPVNSKTTPIRPGLLISDTIDISAQTGGEGAFEFLVYWKLYEFQTSEDINTDLGAFAGINTPAIRSIKETDQEPSGFSAFISINDGGNWTSVTRLTPVAFCKRGTQIRLMFQNSSPEKRYIATFAFLF